VRRLHETADFVDALSRVAEARTEFERAAAMTQNARERALLRGRANACATHG